ncbi:MAG: aminoglycoside phosphotransferase family protein [Burkholderiales bacterium]
MTRPSTRHDIYYWKCDRPAAFHGTAQGEQRRPLPETEAAVRRVVALTFGQSPEALRGGGGQGNHLTFIATVAGRDYFVRLEDGPERDDYIEVESAVMDRVRDLGVPVPRVHASDGSRRVASFAWQILDCIPAPDLNRHFKSGTLVVPEIAAPLGRCIALWQQVPVEGFGPFDVTALRADGRLTGLHSSYASYFFTRLDAHLAFLVARRFLEPAHAVRIREAIERERALLELPAPCLVHKDLALWNVLGTEREILAVIDWDDCVGGDPMDDLALLGCFHDGAFLRQAFGGYASVRPLPSEHVARFWLHLLRNMIFKAVIRVGAGYFDHDSRFFMIGNGGGASLKAQTLSRLDAALVGLHDRRDPFLL